MNLSSPDDIARELKQGRLPAVPDWLVGKAAQQIAEELVPANSKTKLAEIRSAVKTLNGRRYFASTRSIVEAWQARGDFDAIIVKHYVQALIDTALLDKAEAIANDAIERCGKLPEGDPGRRQLDEFRSLLGRIYKQRFVMGDEDALPMATNQYLQVYDDDNRTNYYPGINALACLMLELKTSPLRKGLPEPASLAAAILANVDKPEWDSWSAATASEANLALGDCDRAELWLYRMLTHDETTPFQLDSYARQLRQIWRGNSPGGQSCANRLSDIIARYLASSQGRITIAPSQIPALKTALETSKGIAGLEKNFLGESSFSVDSIRRLLKALASIGCVMNDIGERLGTGFLVKGSALKAEYGDDLVFVTNAHVISNRVSKAIPLDKARVHFELDETVNGQRPQYTATEMLFTSDPGTIGQSNDHGEHLDCTIVRLNKLPAQAAALKVTENLPFIDPLSKAFVAGHPRGSGLQVSLHDSVLLDYDQSERLVHYRTPTDPGSSGSPVFNADWEVMALHHAGTTTTPRLNGAKGTYEANEGISMGAICRKLRS